MGDGGVKVNGIPRRQGELPVPNAHNDRPLQHQVELLPGVGDKPRGLIRGLQRHQQGLHHLVGVAVGQVLKMVFRVAVDHPAVAPAHNVVGVQAGGGAGENLREVYPKFIGYLID